MRKKHIHIQCCSGDSTGIFQGIIGISGIKKDVMMIPRNMDGKIIDKIQGSKIDDGFIGGMPGDELTAIYKNNAGTAHLTFFVANFGATVKFDQKVYTPTDKVHITIIAPDFNFDANVIDKIGKNPESVINIHTSIDKIEKYQLIETGLDTGIFTGEIQLSGKMIDGLVSKTNDIGHNDGKLFCENDDFLEVSFNLFGDEEVSGVARIKYL